MCLITANSTFINGNVSIGTVGCAMALGGFSAAGNSFNISSSSPNNGIDLYNGVPASACGTNCSPAANSHTGSVPVPLFDTTKLPAVPTTLGSCLGCKPNGSTKCPSGSCTYTPGLYNSSIDCSSNGNCTLNRGDYYFSGTNGIIGPSNKNSGTIDGSAGVLIWLNGGNFDTGGGGPIILKPKTSSSGCTYTASEQTVIYAPNYTLKLQGTPANSDVDSSIVVGNLTTGGNPTFQINISTAETCVFTNPGRIRLLQ